MYRVYVCLSCSESKGTMQVLVGKTKDLVDAVRICAHFGFSGFILSPDDERLTFLDA